MARTPKIMAVQGAAVLVGAAFLVFGVLGFIPGVTTHYDQLQWAGHHSGAQLFGVFAVSGLHNVIHLIFGLLGLLMARTYAMLIDHGGPANFVPVNSADNWLHLGLGAVMLLLAVTLAGQRDPTKRRPRRKRTKQAAQA